MLVAFLGILSFFSKSINHNFNNKQYKLQKKFYIFLQIIYFFLVFTDAENFTELTEFT